MLVTKQFWSIKGLVQPKKKILSIITHPHVVRKPIRPWFIFRTQIKIFIDEIRELSEPA